MTPEQRAPDEAPAGHTRRAEGTGRPGKKADAMDGQPADQHTATEGESLTVDQLAARAGVTVRTVRFYSTRGLLPPPAIGPRRVGRYSLDHLSRLALIEELQNQGMTLAAIERYLQRLPEDITPDDLAIHRAMVTSWMPDTVDRATRTELEGRIGRELTDDDVQRLTAMDVLEATDDPAAFRVDPSLLHLGIRLLDLPVSQESIVAARQVMLEHTRSAAKELSRLFRAEVSQAAADGEGHEPEGLPAEDVPRVKSLSAHMQPLVVQALVTAFQRSMKEELRAWIPPEAD